MTPDIHELKRLAQKAEDAKDLHDAWLAKCALSDMYEVATPSTILALIEVVKRQGEALERISDPATYSHNLPSCCQHTFDDTCELFSDIARAALKEPTDV